MRILVTIAHFFDADGGGKHASLGPNSEKRKEALVQVIQNLRQLFDNNQFVIDIAKKDAFIPERMKENKLDIVVCTTRKKHLLDMLSLPINYFYHHETNAEPMMLGFECQAVLRDMLGAYDYYCYLEDDIIITDPLFFKKIKWFEKGSSELAVLQPNRYEVQIDGAVRKVYVDGALISNLTKRFQNINEEGLLKGSFLNEEINFVRVLNPHSGCFFLSQEKMEYWAQKSYFLDKEVSFVSPLESVASLGIMKTFKVYKPALENLNFLEVEHSSQQFIKLVGRNLFVSYNSQGRAL